MEDAGGGRAQPTDCVISAAGLDAPQRGKQLGRLDLAQGAVADLTIELAEIPSLTLDGRLGLVLLFELRGQPFLPDGAKGVLGLLFLLALGLAHDRRVLPLVEQLFGVVALLACHLEGDGREDAEGHVLAFAAKAVAVEPYLGAIHLHPDAQSLAVGQRVFLVRRLGVADFGVAQLVHSGDVPLCASFATRSAVGSRSIPSQNRTTNVPDPMYPALPMYPRCTRRGRMGAHGCEPRRAEM